MNTHDKIELPPLPLSRCGYYTGSDVLEYARAAIEADRRRRELPDTSITNWLDRHGYDTTIGLDGDYADTDVAMLHEAYRLGSQRRGEPVAWHSKQYGVVWMAQPVHGTIDIEDHIASEIAQGKMTREEFLEARQWVRDTYYPVAPQPAEPVKVPSDADLFAIHDEYFPTMVLGHDNYLSFARALLTRYGHMSINPENLCTSAERAQESAESIHEPTLEEEEAWQQMERRNE